MKLIHLMLLSGLGMSLTGGTVYLVTEPPTVRSSVDLATSVAPSATAQPTVLPARSEPPSTQEWNVAPLVEVQGARALHCLAKKVREWIRVTCDGTNNTGGKPKDVRVMNAKLIVTSAGASGTMHSAWDTTHGEVYTARGDSFTSFVCPFMEGMDLEVRFEWTDKSAALIVSWPLGLPEPASKGTYRAVR